MRKLLLTGLSKCAEEACTAMYLRALGNAGLPGTVMTIVTHAEQANISMVSEMAIKALRRVDRQFITEEVRTELMGNTLLSVKALRRIDKQFIIEEVRTELMGNTWPSRL